MSLQHKNASVIFDHSQQNPETLSAAIEDMGFESSPLESSIATPVSTNTHLIPTSGLTPATQQDALKKLSQIQGVLDVVESPAQMGLTVCFIPSLTSVQQLTEVIAGIARLETPTPSSPDHKSPPVSPSHSKEGAVTLVKLSIEGMTCHSCVTTIEGKVGKLKGIEKIRGDVLDSFTSVPYLY